MKQVKLIKKIIVISGLIILTALISIIGSDMLVRSTASNKLYKSVSEIPHNKVGLLLGTGKFLTNGNLNLYYLYRIEAAVELFNAGKIDFILVSGDNSSPYYDEASAMKEDLMNKGVPSEKIFLDYAGFRTLDSVVRCKMIFGQKSITVISQQFHNERAIYIACQKNINAVGYNASDVSAHYGLKTQLREKLARVKMIIDLITGKNPKFLGETIEIK